jgi:transcription initiation factor TFIID subunit 12
VKWIQEAKSKYLKALVAMEGASNRVQTIDSITKQRIAEGRPLSPEEDKDFKEKKESSQKTYNDAKNFVDGFRNSQNQQRTAANGGSQAQQATSNAGPPNVVGPAPVRPQMSVQQQAQNPAAMQNTQTVNAAIEAAKNQQMGGNRPSMPQNGQMSQQSSTPSQNTPSSLPQQQAGQPQIKTEAGIPPPINTAITQMQANQNRPMQNSPQSAVPRSAGIPQSATSQQQQQPQALSHSDALNQAARSYSNTVPTTSVMGQSHTHPPQAIPRDQNVMTNKMPIPKHLPERATAPPQPVPMQQSRPTFTGGPSNTGNGVISQPVLTKTPQFTMEGEGDRVLSKKKLDELVRQVTGGGQVTENGECLAPDVEEVCYLFLVFCHFLFSITLFLSCAL